MQDVFLVYIDLNQIKFETNGFKMIVEKKVQSFINLNELMRTIGLTKTLIHILIYDKREYFQCQLKIC